MNSDGTFSMDESESGLSLSGTWATTAAGFKKLTVTVSSDTGSVALGSTAYALDIPGIVLLVKPYSGTQMISMVKSGECPQGDFSANWIMTNANTNMASDLFGTFAFTASSGSANLPARYQLDDTDLGADPLGSLICSNGVATVGDARMYLTQIGAAIVHTGVTSPGDPTDDNFIVGLPATSVGSLSNLDGNYLGLVFAESAGTDELFPVSISLSNGTGTGDQIDPDTGVSSGSASISLVSADAPSTGFISGTIGGSDVRCMANVDVNSSGKNFLFCIGENPGEAGRLYNMLMINI
jgi:hypothetical protein